MQTIQASRTYMMCARDKVVDLGEYRRSLADCWSVPTQAPAEPRVLPVPVPISRPRRRSSRLRRCALGRRPEIFSVINRKRILFLHTSSLTRLPN